MSGQRNVLLVGSVGLDDAETVFRTLGGTVGGLAKRFPDGECGPRSNWISWQIQVIGDDPQFTVGETIEIPLGGSVRKLEKHILAEGVDPASVEFAPLGYADAAKSSYEIFCRLRNAGDIPSGTRFQVSLPTPVAVITQHFAAEAQAAVEPAYERAMIRETEEIAAAIPADDLAIQWDVCQEVLAADGAWKVFYDDLIGDAVDRIARLSASVPDGVELGFHLCYGDPGHKHIKEPADLGICVTIANRIGTQVGRGINWIHMPVPRDRNDDAYFAPLADLKLQAGCELYLGLVHLTDGLDGAKGRLSAAQSVRNEFGIATECGFGRRAAETIPGLLALHAEIATS